MSQLTIQSNGTKVWNLDGQPHRTDGPAIEWADGSKSWYLNGRVHRIDGPALVKANGSKYWILDGRFHRFDGPAFEKAFYEKKWYLFDVELTESEHAAQVALMSKVKAWVMHRTLMRKTRRFVRLCRSKEFIEHFYAPEHMGGVWSKKQLEACVA